MSKRKTGGRSTPGRQPRRRLSRRSVVAVIMSLSLLGAGVALARLGSLRGPSRPAPEPATPAAGSFSPASPSKEYIYAGGRLVATEEPNGAPAAPTALGGSYKSITWTDNSNNESGFKVEREATECGSGWTQIGAVGPDVTTYKQGIQCCGTKYRVRAWNASGDSNYSNVATPEDGACYRYDNSTVDSAAEGFSATQNPSGAWSYGYQASAGAPFTLFVNNNNIFGLEPGLSTWYLTNAFNLPALIHNATGSPKSYYGATHPPDLLNLFPGTASQRSVVRWRAQGAATIKIEGRFQGLDATTTDVSVTHNLTASLFAANVTGFGSQSPFSITRAVAAGDTIEFAVGNGNGDLQHDSTGLSVKVTVQAPPPLTYDAVGEFSPTQNQGVAWSYGYRTPTAFALLPSNSNIFGLEAGMHTWYLPNAFNLPAVIHNGTGMTKSYYTATHPPDLLNLFPGAAGEKAVVRWTAVRAGTAQIGGRFQGLDATTTDASVVQNSTSIFSGNVNGLGNQLPFTLTRAVAAGDTIEFRVGYGGNGTVASDHTGLAVTITLQ